MAVEVDRLTSVENLTAKQEISLNKHFSAMKDKPVNQVQYGRWKCVYVCVCVMVQVVFENPGDCPLQYKEPDGLWE